MSWIQKAFGSDVEVAGNPEGSPRSGAFEVTDDAGTVYWSKLSGQGFPTEDELVAAMREKGFSE